MVHVKFVRKEPKATLFWGAIQYLMHEEVKGGKPTYSYAVPIPGNCHQPIRTIDIERGSKISAHITSYHIISII